MQISLQSRRASGRPSADLPLGAGDRPVVAPSKVSCFTLLSGHAQPQSTECASQDALSIIINSDNLRGSHFDPEGPELRGSQDSLSCSLDRIPSDGRTPRTSLGSSSSSLNNLALSGSSTSLKDAVSAESSPNLIICHFGDCSSHCM